MKFFIDISHPADVHLYKHFIFKMKRKGHEFLITARDKEVTRQLLDAYEIEYIPIGKAGFGILSLFWEWMKRDIMIFKIAKKFNPDYLLGALNPVIAHIGWMLNKPSIIFTDYEPSSIKLPLAYYATVPFVSKIIVPSSVRHNYGAKSIKINSLKELAYLHPDRFKPDPQVLNDIGLDPDDRFAILRFVGWGAHHDINEEGLSLDDKIHLLNELQKYCIVFISSEEKLADKLKKNKIPVKPENLHSLLYYASLLVCDSQTMATEAAVLGTPVVRSNSFVGERDLGYIIELDKKYHLIFNIREPKKAIEKAKKLIQNPNLKREWKDKREKLLKDKNIDIVQFMINLIEKLSSDGNN